ncbi:two-component system, NtrC family, sensor histidine kinase HupT/HoxJ [Aromatoleum tolulyticum]|uniref:histidine kinase n=1 Tax=Aromatoleum tolulyticum TaxID=34027 RepID=A0A1N6WE92_9RHOO|nr:ATP-binding protein [Aromatoleum tolulyticum]SIQ88463.1 two-component system, NtrC family, sensor histidine kinase HupT/HoxJ [Aromatoleum tolulyticum]
MSDQRPPAKTPGQTGHPGELIAVDEDMWMDVIHKMDEVYSDLLQYEVALEEKNAKLEESQQFILSVLTSMSDIMVVCDRNGLIEDVNLSLVDFCGRDAAELRGRAIYELFADELPHDLARELLGSFGQQAVHDRELPLRARDGSVVPVSLNCTPRFSAVGKSLGMVITGRPVGELRKAYHALRQAHEDLKRTQQQLLHSEKMASLGRLVAGVAHELNNPISFVLGNVHALKRYAERLQRYLAAVHGGESPDALADLRAELRIDRILGDLPPLIEGTIEGAERTRDIVDGLKRFSAIDRDENRPFDLRDVVERAVRWVCKAARDSFHVDVDLPDPLPLTGSSGQMQQIVMNLVQNACDATAGRPDPRLEIRAELDNGGVRILFHDNGPGLAPDILERIFDPFFTTKPVGMGTGLGLAISYGIVERHGGRLTAANHAEGGAVFVVEMPLTT